MDNDLWEKINNDEDAIVLDMEEFESVFQQNSAMASKKSKLGAGNDSSKMATRQCVLDANSSRNVEIALKTLGVPIDAIATAVTDMDMGVLTPAVVERLVALIPSEEDVAAIKKFSGELSGLSQASQFMYHMVKVEQPDFEHRIRALHFKNNFETGLASVAGQLQALEEARLSIMNSAALSKILGMVLRIGTTTF
jgi:hypothetical protein